MRAAANRSLVLIALLGLVVGACQPAPAAAPLSDPREIVMAGVSSIAKTQFVHAHADMSADLNMQDIGAQQGNMTIKMTLDADVDLVKRNVAMRWTSSMGGIGGDAVSDGIFVDGQQFSRTLPETRWTQFPAFGNQPTFPSNEDIAAAVNASLDGAGVVLRLADPQACGGGTCYHVIAELDPVTAWQMLAPVLAGGNQVPPGMNLDPISVDILVDQASRALIGLNAAVTFQGSKTTMALILSDHDVPIAISAPPPNLVDQFDNGFFDGNAGGGGMIIHGDATSAPMPAESIPAESP